MIKEAIIWVCAVFMASSSEIECIRALPTNIIKGWIISSHVKFLNYEAPGRCSFIAKEHTPLLIECFQSKSVIYWPRPTANILSKVWNIAFNLIVLVNEHWWKLKHFHADGLNIVNFQNKLKIIKQPDDLFVMQIPKAKSLLMLQFNYNTYPRMIKIYNIVRVLI